MKVLFCLIAFSPLFAAQAADLRCVNQSAKLNPAGYELLFHGGGKYPTHADVLYQSGGEIKFGTTLDCEYSSGKVSCSSDSSATSAVLSGRTATLTVVTSDSPLIARVLEVKLHCQ